MWSKWSWSKWSNSKSAIRQHTKKPIPMMNTENIHH